jgi:alkanesulfonate monooxygenase SsuD/methylene tetrahydromethanopterin reductase-like flavin-dependent oxidoreductase (luciferase family)
MKFSLFIEAQLADGRPPAEQQMFHDIVAQAELADALGFHAIWAVEHHGLYEYSHCSAPEVLLAFIAARTKTIRLGHGVTLSPGRYNHPIRIAERIATLDILSGGRMNWGSGKSSTRVEQEAFEVDKPELDGQWREALEIIPRMWRSDIFEHRGTHYNIPPTAIIPRPLQQPNPPVYIACSRPESIVSAGTLGVGSLNFAGGTEAQLQENVVRYRSAIGLCQQPPRRITNQFCCTPAAMILEDDREACAIGFRGARYHQEGLGHYFFSPNRSLGSPELNTAPLGSAELDRAMAARHHPNQPLNTVIGDPDAALRSVRRFQKAGVDELILVMQMGTVPQEAVMRSLRLFGEKVMPRMN